MNNKVLLHIFLPFSLQIAHDLHIKNRMKSRSKLFLKKWPYIFGQWKMFVMCIVLEHVKYLAPAKIWDMRNLWHMVQNLVRAKVLAHAKTRAILRNHAIWRMTPVLRDRC